VKRLTRRQRLLFRAVKRYGRKVVPECDRRVRGTFCERVFASGVALPNRFFDLSVGALFVGRPIPEDL
jgi:hypothetical protein